MFISLCISVVLIKLQFDIDQKRLNDYTCIILQVWLKAVYKTLKRWICSIYAKPLMMNNIYTSAMNCSSLNIATAICIWLDLYL